MRGKGQQIQLALQAFGITPAYAGKSPRLCRSLPVQGDHPRLCGEKDHVERIFLVSRGSPPPMRGKARNGAVRIAHSGITPAYAGKSGAVIAIRICWRDHPRLCGEKDSPRRFKSKEKGSPPPMRGKDCNPYLGNRRNRITPAYAGKSEAQK